VRVEADDPDGDWTRAGVFEVGENIYRIPLPLPADGLRAVNVYAIADDDGLILIDSGWAIAEAREVLDKAVAALDRGLADVRRFLVTHVHRDHYAMAVAVRREFGTVVSLGAGEQPSLDLLQEAGHKPLTNTLALLERCGAAHLMMALLREYAGRATHDPADWAGPDDWLADGTTVVTGRRTLGVIATPGHTQGHVIFVDAAAGLLFAGDHVLPHITPSIGFEGVNAALPLGDYLESLRLVREMADHQLLPAHGPVTSSAHARIDELIAHHGRRLDEAAAVIGADGANAYETASRLTWTRRLRAFSELDLFNQMLAVTETAAHLELLVAQGRLTASDGIVRRYVQP
jgi:glyoxylase-like metal-dependent hydrolase (beta-lactamase superfamily II)